MRKRSSFAIALFVFSLFTATSSLNAKAAGFYGESFKKIIYYSGPSGKGSHAGTSAGNAKAITDGDVMAIEAGTVITAVYMILDTAVTGSTAIDIGDDDDADGFVPTASITLATPGLYGGNAKVAGAYMRVQTAGATDALDIYVVPNVKFYQAAGKEVKLDNTTTNTAGAFRIVVEGYKVGA